MNKYVAFDTETGGVTLDTSLLTAYFAVLDENFEMVDELYLRLKPEDGRYFITAGALKVNGINLIEHDSVAITYKEAKTLLYRFLEKNYRGEKLIPIGHGVYFDIVRIKQDLISQGSWEGFVSYRSLDTSVAAQFLCAAGLFPEDVSGSLGSLVKYFNLPSQGKLHDARIDTLQTIAVLRELLKLVKH